MRDPRSTDPAHTFRPVTFHASDERASRLTLEAQRSALGRASFSLDLLDLVTSPVIVVNEARQAVFLNQPATELLVTGPGEILGRRPGELFGCLNEPATPSGCGTGLACRSCGLVNAILAAMADDRVVVRETSFLTRDGTASELKVSATPLTVDGHRFVLAELVDLSDAKRRLALERTFFHDLLNVASGIEGLLQTIDADDAEHLEATLGMIRSSTAQLIHEIEAQRVLTYAEHGDLEAKMEDGSVADTVGSATAAVRAMAEQGRIELLVTVDPPDLRIRTDHTLLGRAAINLLKNAIEANGHPARVSVRVRASRDGARIEIHNAAHIPETARIFHRSFSTKGPGRGLGTFSAKLITERYLGGTISYTSHPDDGTTFVLSVPSS